MAKTKDRLELLFSPCLAGVRKDSRFLKMLVGMMYS